MKISFDYDANKHMLGFNEISHEFNNRIRIFFRTTSSTGNLPILVSFGSVRDPGYRKTGLRESNFRLYQ